MYFYRVEPVSVHPRAGNPVAVGAALSKRECQSMLVGAPADSGV